MADLAALTKLIEPKVKALGFDLVRVTMTGGTSDPTLQIMAERPETRQLTLTDCESISREIDPLLEEADPIERGYRLEVSSPGIDRPLTRRKDYADWAGHEARIKFADEQDGSKQISGDIVGIDGETVTVATPKGERSVEFSNIASAKLLLTDKLINATAPLDSEGADLIKTEG
jgi:ribosome maturation factor RimP